jgi:spermidine/putrescine transport system ATP-binding protein
VPDKPDRNAIEIRGVSKVFGTGDAQVAALRAVSLSIRENEFFTLLGLRAAARPRFCG